MTRSSSHPARRLEARDYLSPPAVVAVVLCLFAACTLAGDGELRAWPPNGPVGSTVAELTVGYEFITPEGETTFPDNGCRVLTVTHATCGVSRALAQGWVRDLHEIAQALPSESISTGWIVFGDPQRAAATLYRWLQGPAPPTWLTTGAPQDAERFVRLAGYPHTLLIDQYDTVRSVISGNQLPTAEQLRSVCRASIASRSLTHEGR